MITTTMILFIYFLLPFLKLIFDLDLEVLRGHDYLQEPMSLEEQIHAAKKEIARLEEDNKKLRSKKCCLNVSSLS